MGLATRFFTANALKVTDGCIMKVKLIHASIGIIITVVFEAFVQPPFTVAPSLYYIFQFIKYTVPPVLIITDIPFITGLTKVSLHFLIHCRASVSSFISKQCVHVMVYWQSCKKFGLTVETAKSGRLWLATVAGSNT